MRKPYVDETYYESEYEGIEITSGDFYQFSKRASDVVDMLTEYLIQRVGLENLADQSQELIMKATCAQIEYYQVEGLESDVTGNSISSGSVSIGSFGYGANRMSSDTNRQRNRVAPNCLTYLQGTGLLRKRGAHIGII